MPAPALVPLGRTDLPPFPISARLQSQLVYFMSTSDKPGIPRLAEKEYWFDPDEVRQWLDEGVFYLVSPLDTANRTEVELSDEQEALLLWLQSEGVRHVRLVE
jgi:hypothetical protein